MFSGDPLAVNDSSEARAFATAKSLEVVVAAPDELQLDLDDPLALDTYHNNFPLAEKLFGPLVEVRKTTSKSGVGTHVVVRLPHPFDAAQRVALQACLGSDLRREMRSIARIRADDPEPILFFETRPFAATASRAILTDEDTPF